MSVSTWDGDGQARAAMAYAVSNFGEEILSDPDRLENVFRDLLPDSPREVTHLVSAARANVALLLKDRIAQHIDPDTAVQLTADAVSERQGLDRAACRWATAEFAGALGYGVSDAGGGVSDAGRGPNDAGRGASDAGRGPSTPPISPPGTSGWRPDSEAVAPESATVTEGTERGRTPPLRPPPVDGEPATRASGNRRRVVIPAGLALAVVGVVVGILLSQHKPPPPPPPTTTTRPAGTTSSPSPTTVPVAALSQLLPKADQGLDNCTNPAPASIFDGDGVTSDYNCSDPNLGAVVKAIQFGTFAGYENALQAVNEADGFDSAAADTSCPPTGTQGEEEYEITGFPFRSGQVLECFTDDFEYWYLWTYPSENAYLLAGLSSGWPENWWSDGDAEP